MPIYKKKQYFKCGDNVKLHNDLKNLLSLQREPVGIQFYFNEDEFNQGEFEESKFKMAYCVFVEKASRKEMAFKTKLENHFCDGATTVLGLEDANQAIKTGRVYHSYGLYKTKGIAHKVWRNVTAIRYKETPVYGISIGPLKNFKSNPDLVIIISESLAMMKIIQGHLYNTGQRMSLDVSAMQGMCSEVTALPYMENKINISMLCPSTRTLAKWKSSELAAGIPYSSLSSLIMGINQIKDC